MKKIDLTEANGPLAEYIKRMEGEPLTITFRGVTLAALVPHRCASRHRDTGRMQG